MQKIQAFGCFSSKPVNDEESNTTANKPSSWNHDKNMPAKLNKPRVDGGSLEILSLPDEDNDSGSVEKEGVVRKVSIC